MIATIPSEATRGARAVRDGPKYGGRRGGAPGGTEEVGCDAYAFNRPLNVRFGPDGCAYVVDYGAVRDLSPDSHFVGPPANGPLVQISGTGVIWKLCPM